MARVNILNEVSNGTSGEWKLCFQWCEYVYDDGSTENGYRFIWRKPDNTLQAARGQARIPSFEDMQELILLATRDGWLITVEKKLL
ncbi:hypothetical protein EB1_05520 [Empedobacter brevis NBRC 14943 = ATCC 43319]|uniref:Uncharacterized protein n=1 Tax=Empedobacter brevis NBRC 14943 = ATCC 43319 TaxID=1218108 RepID=A0A511ND72_9FLAO|nr:hypothetical protein [Empedobacter brevis]GEM50762.1 hypothetical protein EB1_05520 [Empedobacter brevis NBRC 14943 = ATCC 43319]